MGEELQLTQNNKVWKLVDLPNGFRPIGVSRYIKPRKTIKESFIESNLSCKRIFSMLGN